MLEYRCKSEQEKAVLKRSAQEKRKTDHQNKLKKYFEVKAMMIEKNKNFSDLTCAQLKVCIMAKRKARRETKMPTNQAGLLPLYQEYFVGPHSRPTPPPSPDASGNEDIELVAAESILAFHRTVDAANSSSTTDIAAANPPNPTAINNITTANLPNPSATTNAAMIVDNVRNIGNSKRAQHALGRNKQLLPSS